MNIPPQPHLYRLLLRRAERFPDAIALGAQHNLSWRTLTSRQMLEHVDSLAAELADRRVTEGDRIVLWLPNTALTPIYFFALWKLGAIIVPFDREMNPSAGAQILKLVEPRLVLGGYGERPAWLDGAELTEWWEPGSASSAQNARLGAPAAWTPPGEELAAFYFTSGTTGSPKGCMITHANLQSQVDVLQKNVPLDTSCRAASILPLSHLFELTCGLLFPLAAGAAIHYIPSRRGPDILRVLNEQHPTHMIAVPQLLTAMGQTLEQQLRSKLPQTVLNVMFRLADRLPQSGRRRLFWLIHRKLGGQLRFVAVGGAALPVDVQRLWARLGVRVVLGYGTSECSPIIAFGAPDGSTPYGSVGKAIDGVEIRLTAEGEMQVRGPNVMRGYFKDPDRTLEVLQDGWYSTGDIGTIDQQGNVTLTGRAKDLIVLPSGLKVWPTDVEDVLRGDPAVRDAVVILVPSETSGATLHAYLIPNGRAARGVAAKDVATRCNRQLALHQRIATASWWPEADFPRTSTLKVRRQLLPMPSAAEVPDIQTSSTEFVNDAISQAVMATAHTAMPRGDQTLAELGIDSLGLVDLVLDIEEKTGVAANEAGLNPSMTVDEVRTFFEDLKSSAGATARGVIMPLWPYTWGRGFRWLSFPFDLLYRRTVTETIVLGAEHLRNPPRRVLFAGTHHSFADVPLVRFGLARTPAAQLRRRLVVAAAADGFGNAGWLGKYAVAAFGLFPLLRTGDRDASLRQLVRIGRAGNVVLIFPQGRHCTSEEEISCDPLATFKPGFAYLAEALGAGVVPFGLAGTEQLIPPQTDGFEGRVIAGVPVQLSRRPLAIAFGQPLIQEPTEEAQEFSARVQGACFALTRQAEAALQEKK